MVFDIFTDEEYYYEFCFFLKHYRNFYRQVSQLSK